jgi:predicted ATPase
MLELGETWGDARIMATACMRSGVACFGLGDLGTAQAVLERGLSLFNPADRPFYSAFSIQDLQVTLLNFLSHTLFCLGHIDRSVQSLNEALSISESLSHPYTRAHALAHVCWTGWMTDPRERILAAAEAAVRLSTEHDFAFYLGMSMVFQGWAMAGGESTEAALATIERGLAMCAEIGAVSYRPLLLVVSAAAYANSGRPEQGLARIAEAREVMARADERWAEAELLRMNGRLLLACNEHAAAEAAFDDAMKIARSQNARTWELRSAMSMARLWSDQGKRQAARELLAPVYDWFTEGFNTLDLREAKALLGELG